MTLTLPYPPSAAGVYRIVDVKTGRFYIGSSVDIAKRWGHHLYRLGKGSHPNPILQAIWNADPQRLQVSLIELCGAERGEILRREQVHLNAAGVGVSRECMNVLPVAGSHLGRKRSAETRAAMSLAQKGRRRDYKPRLQDRKLSPEQVKEIRLAKAAGESYSALQRRYGLSIGPLQRVISRKTYADVQ